MQAKVRAIFELEKGRIYLRDHARVGNDMTDPDHEKLKEVEIRQRDPTLYQTNLLVNFSHFIGEPEPDKLFNRGRS